MRFLVVLLAFACSAFTQSFDERMEAQVEKLIAKHGTGSDRPLQQRLLRMGKEDQAVRLPREGSVVSVEKQQATDDRLTRELKRIVASKGWPTIALVGLQASENAALVLTHSRDHDFQRAMLPRMQELADKGEILGSSVAYIVDKILVSEKKLQRFVTQLTWAGGVGKILPVEDVHGLDDRREKYMLPPMAEYKKVLADLYKLKTE